MFDRSLNRPGTLAAVVTAGAGAIHFAVAVLHFGASPLLGFGFAAVGWAQIVGAALLLYRPGRTLGIGVAGLNALAIASWVLSRTVGLPIGTGAPEPVAWPGLLAVALEGGAILGLLSQRGREPALATMPAVATLSAFVLAFGGSVTAMAQLGTSGHAHGSAENGESAQREDHPGSTEAARSDAGEGRAHAHPDGSLHLHLVAPVHRHSDGTVHVHTDADDTPGPSPSPSDHEHRDGHTHP